MKRSLVFVFLLIFALPSPAASARECMKCREIREKGFPEAYASRLCALSLDHPQWEFRPLLISELARAAGEDYSFSRVLAEETAEGRSLVSAKEEYRPYWGEERVLWDSGYYEASRETVAYFLDPRPHLTEKGVFQFLLFSEGDFSREAVSFLLKETDWGTDAVVDAILSAAESLDVSPLLLALRLFGEQGTKGNALLSGLAGDRLWEWYEAGTEMEGERWVASPKSGYEKEFLLSLNGYFNPFHDGATGAGSFEIYYRAALRGRKMGWDSLEKGIMGGGRKLVTEYVNAFQGTPYLQKFNVDVRSRTPLGESRNFWGQYMQSVSAAKEEGDRLAALLGACGLSEEPFVFLIPVYEALPEEPCPDPAEGRVTPFATQSTVPSPHLFAAEEAVEKVPPVTEKKRGEVPARETAPAFSSFGVLIFSILIFAPFLPLFFVWILKKREQFWRKYTNIF